VPLLLEAMRAQGGRPPYIARLAGGAALFGSMLGSAAGQMGERNIKASRAALEIAGVRLAGEETGGSAGRSVSLDVATGELTVKSVRGGIRVL
jgi:chemotaxis protein CheD